MTAATSENALSCELVQGITILERLGIIDFNGHFSARLDNDHILINSGSSIRSRITTEQCVRVTIDGGVDEQAQAPPKELALHLAVYAARPDVRAIVHGHPEWSTLLSATGRPYEVTMAQGALLGDVPTFQSPRSVNNAAIAAEVAAALGDGNGMLLRSHGSIVVARDVLEATVHAIYLELNAERQVRCAAIGDAYVFSSEEAAACRKGLANRGLFEKCWNFYEAKFDLA